MEIFKYKYNLFYIIYESKETVDLIIVIEKALGNIIVFCSRILKQCKILNLKSFLNKIVNERVFNLIKIIYKIQVNE